MEQVRQQYMVLKKNGAEVDDKDYADAFERAHQAELKAAQDSGKYIGKLLKEQSPTEGYIEAINVALQLAKNNGVSVEVSGCYIWISNTKREDMECRNILKGAGFWWARNRRKWYWKPDFLKGRAAAE
jgi:NADPH-dependent ferric siderophore reductase